MSKKAGTERERDIYRTREREKDRMGVREREIESDKERLKERYRAISNK